ncbi:pentatricopeptide repeat-containing protein At2g02980, chloroplastic-like [Nicotiana tabacum]|uniref:Pentatricopeptide repeat-containing protein At2g02980, chloroplastic-like n=1 Tax=Nicotiana tabacum TaxID=4097 RepID=A0A1S3Y1R1_TOBAC|nr:PREDICTED: pentatricopeptide repeat-containing protein At2g02980, chloroplastic-like [Nicotiana tabacum]XP_016445933.1 PREDICTED: pentatricopeptide repeat-containing protein At2g02980, chloroplastic-like [Nicotiana tabacum]
MAFPAPTLKIGTFSCQDFITKNSRKDTFTPIDPFSLVPKCKSLRDLKQIQAFSIKTHMQNDVFFMSKLINFCTADPTPASLHHAHLLFDQIPQPDIVLFNFLARGYARSGTPLNAFVLFLKILTLGVAPDFYTFPSLLKACAGAEALEEGKQLHCLLIKYGLNDDIYVCPALMNIYIECNDNGSARLVFDRIADPCVVMYNAIIMGYVRSSEPNEALLLFRELQVKKLKPTDVTILGVVSSCALLGSLGFGKWVHEYVKKNGFDQYVKVNTALIDMYAKCGSLPDAISVYESMSYKDTQAWSAMIMAYATHGRALCAISLFQEMQNARVRPDGITFLGLLYACNHSGLIEEGFRFFNSMKESYRIVPGVKHYGCMLDLMARAGRLNDAFKFLMELPIYPTVLLWRTLLAACSTHGNMDLGKLVLEKIFEMDKSHSGDYVIFSNICARAGKWEEVNYIWKLMKVRGVKKIPGCSSIEVDNIMHEFFSGEVTRIEHRELHQEVDKLIEKLKLFGYVPDNSIAFRPGLEDEEKEATLRYHSEKLAITFGLLNSPPGKTIRVVKNLRICGDCHSAAKLISLIFKRNIIIRDMQRFHHFEGGKCSCGDFW